MEIKEIFLIWNHQKCICYNRLYTSESDVCRRQILTYKDSPRAERINPLLGEYIRAPCLSCPEELVHITPENTEPDVPLAAVCRNIDINEV